MGNPKMKLVVAKHPGTESYQHSILWLFNNKKKQKVLNEDGEFAASSAVNVMYIETVSAVPVIMIRSMSSLLTSLSN